MTWAELVGKKIKRIEEDKDDAYFRRIVFTDGSSIQVTILLIYDSEGNFLEPRP